MLDSDIVVGEFDLQSSYYVHFWTSSLGKGIDLITHPTPAMG